MRSEVRLEAVAAQTLSQMNQQGVLPRTCSGNHGNVSRLPLSIISTNTFRCRSATNSTVVALRSGPAFGFHPPPVCDDMEMIQSGAEDSDAVMDIWTVIKPGHVREKIGLFASDGGRTGTSLGSGDWDTNHTAITALSRAGKAKGMWEESGSAKRRRRVLHHDAQQHGLRACPDGRRGDELVSVVEMVAFLEQRASEQHIDSPLSLQRSSTPITLSRAPPPELREGSEVKGEESESIRVSDMVAKLESEYLRRRTEGDLSRSNSLRRTGGRVLQSSAPCQPSSPSPSSSPSSPPSSPSPQSSIREPISRSQTVRMVLTTPLSPGLATPHINVTEMTALAPPPEGEEPLPGLLFLSPPPPTDSEPHSSGCRPSCDLQPAPPKSCQSGRKAMGVSQDFLDKRHRLQQLLEPQPILSLLPHHLLLKILLLLPTQSLAALKCTCSYFLFIIDRYGVRPADSLWVSDPRYRDDPCKQCKKRYGRGDVSLCRWHHKPFCQALPYGPGYWMCCRSNRREAPGCNVGLHDNRWVPAFCSVNVPVYRRSRNHDDDLK
ncbi:F-box only protein 34 [Mugil cephalus]|uniref:F-box only protein 34 n=1 Tax=Mugil cephalus TaxID=48193 RepID=UPI001FB74B03|nr:F-box only protein 34 [Mugil cephalus]XP_047466144.1 F-box only protein 34 [Mugil cephalus]XP_047466146.1 F-box only protein 34 [Mugil cephalus]